MVQLEFVKELYTHMDWADSMVWQAVLASEKATSDDVLQDTLMHLHKTQRAFLEVWHERSVDLPGRSDFNSPVELMAWARSYHPLAKEFLDGLSIAAFDNEITIPWVKYFEDKIGGPAAPVTLGESVYQVVAHSMYHRGQANRRLREVGGQPTLVDYIAWIWAGRPEPVWDQ